MMAGLNLLDMKVPERPREYDAMLPKGGYEEVREAEERRQRPVVGALAGMVLDRYEEARTAKDYEITPKLLHAARVRNGEHDAEFLRVLAEKRISKSYVKLLGNACDIAKAELRQLYFSGEKVVWGAEPTPLPSLPEAAVQEAMARSDDMLIRFVEERGEPASQGQLSQIREWGKEVVRRQMVREAKTRAVDAHRFMDDIFLEGGWFQAIYDALDDITTFPNCFILGPMPRREWVMRFKGSRYQYEQVVVDKWKCVHPRYIYPQPGISSLDEGYVIVRGEMQRQEVEGLIGVPGVDSGAVRSMLATEDRSDMSWDHGTDQEMEYQERKGPVRTRDTEPGKFDTLLYMGPVKGTLLQAHGVDAPAESNKPCMVKVVGTAVVKAVVDRNPAGTKPLSTASYFDVPHAFWGVGIPEKCADIEKNYHSVLRSMSQNMSIASGPQVMAWIDAFQEGEDIEDIYPWKLWLLTGEPGVFRGPQGSGMKPLDFHQPDTMAHLLITCATFYQSLVDRHTGVSSIDSGSMDVHGAGRTASGMQLAEDRSNTTMRGVTQNIDRGLIHRGPATLWEYLLVHRRVPDELIGDLRVVGMGLSALNQKMQQAVRSTEFLSMVGSSDAFLGILGRQRIMSLLRTGSKLAGLEWESDDTELPPVPSWAADALGVDAPPPQGPPPGGGGGQGGGSLPSPGGDAGPAATGPTGQVAGGGDTGAPPNPQMGPGG